MTPDRFATIAAVPALTATARGMVAGDMRLAARQAFGELTEAVGKAGWMPAVHSCIALFPDAPWGADDPYCRYVAGFVFGQALSAGSSQASCPPVPLDGTLAWTTLSAGRYAVFTHRGPYRGLGQTWSAIFHDWARGAAPMLRDGVPFELPLNTPDQVPENELVTEIWVPVTDALAHRHPASPASTAPPRRT